MHMADALLSPAVGGTLWAASAGSIAWCSRRVKNEMDDRRIPLMGVLGAFIFAAQMINFTIPGTGASGHLGGGMILAIILGPHAAFLTLASILMIQALFFADGGLLALGCNIFNLGALPCFIAYPLLYRPLAGKSPASGRIVAASVVAAVVGLQLGAFGVVVETFLSGISALPLATFLLLMQPIHLAIGIVEGLVTALVVTFIWKARPEVLVGGRLAGDPPLKKLLAALAAVTVVTSGALSWFASTNPDGLEWAIANVAGQEELPAPANGIHDSLAKVQERTAFLPDYGVRKENSAPTGPAAWPAVDPGTTAAGLIGGLITVALAVLVGVLLRWRCRKTPPG